MKDGWLRRTGSVRSNSQKRDLSAPPREVSIDVPQVRRRHGSGMDIHGSGKDVTQVRQRHGSGMDTHGSGKNVPQARRRHGSGVKHLKHSQSAVVDENKKNDMFEANPEFTRLSELLDALSALTDEEIFDDNSYSDCLIDQVYTIAIENVSNDARLQVLAEALHKKWLADSRFCEIAAKLAYRLAAITSPGSDLNFRHIILSLVWHDFRDRQNLRMLSKRIFANSARFAFEFYFLFENLEEFYILLRPITQPLYEYLFELMQTSPAEVEVAVVYDVLTKMGAVVESMDPAKFIEYALLLRKRLIDSHSTEYMRACLMHLVELHRNRWRSDRLPDGVRELYEKRCVAPKHMDAVMDFKGDSGSGMQPKKRERKTRQELREMMAELKSLKSDEQFHL